MALALLGAVGCGGAPSAGAPDMASHCPNDLPDSCPTPAPSWDGGVSEVVATVCATCHKAGGEAADKQFNSYDDVYARRGVILSQIYSCFMPPPDSVTLTPAERQMLLGWLVCGAPNN